MEKKAEQSRLYYLLVGEGMLCANDYFEKRYKCHRISGFEESNLFTDIFYIRGALG